MPRFRRVSVHISDIRTFDRCRRLWWFTSENSMNLAPNIPIPALWLGTGVHLGLDAFYLDEDPIETYDRWLTDEWVRIKKEFPYVWDEELDVLKEQAALGKTMLQHYKLWAKRNDDFEVLATERLFSVPIKHPDRQRALPNAYFEGRIDGLARDEHGRLWILEHKTAKRFPDVRTLEFNDQATGYVLAAQDVFGIRPYGVIFTFLKKKAPAPLQELVRGGLSVNKAQAVSPESAMASFRQCGIDPRSDQRYLEFLLHLEEAPHKFFRRYRVYRTEVELDHLREKLYWAARVMRSKGTPMWPANVWYACGLGCSFEGPCRALSTGGDWRAILDAQYHLRTEPTDDEKNEEELPVAPVVPARV